jgi:ABC-type multidrug transport system ATPase subunit
MRVILGLDAPDAGNALIGGRPYQSLRRPLTHVGALLDAAALQPSRSARNHLLWLAHSQGLTASRVDQVVAQSGVQGAIRRKAGGYSLGMRQRLGIAAALLGDPPVLMLDEPFNGMDPEGIVWMRGFLRSLAAEGRAVLVSSHLMSELQDTADHVIVIGRGRVIADASVAELTAKEPGAPDGRICGGHSASCLMSSLSHSDQAIRRQTARAVAQSRRSAWVLLECLEEEPERGDMPWADDAEVLAVYCRDLREVQRSAIAITAASTMPRGRLTYCSTSSAMREMSPSSTSATWKPLPPNDFRKVTSACGPTRDWSR